jgi:hypothetical protein
MPLIAAPDEAGSMTTREDKVMRSMGSVDPLFLT